MSLPQSIHTLQINCIVYIALPDNLFRRLMVLNSDVTWRARCTHNVWGFGHAYNCHGNQLRVRYSGGCECKCECESVSVSVRVWVWECESVRVWVQVWECESVRVRVWECEYKCESVWECESVSVRVWECEMALKCVRLGQSADSQH